MKEWSEVKMRKGKKEWSGGKKEEGKMMKKELREKRMWWGRGEYFLGI